MRRLDRKMYAYDKLYLSRAQGVLGSMLDFAVNDLGIPVGEFYMRFLVSPVSEAFQSGESAVIAGRSGIELAADILEDRSLASRYRPNANRSPEYWAGWALAYFQWNTGLQFARINASIPITEILNMYNPFHEMDITQFCDHMAILFSSRNTVSNLKRRRVEIGLSQSELAKLSEVPVRTIQQYEQRQKNINAAKAETLIRIAKYLYCSVEDLMELNP